MSDQPLVSIIIPCYNAEQWIQESLASCLNQTYSNIEVIVVDDGSTDGSLEVIRQFHVANREKVRYYTKCNGGSSSARNFGINVSRGNYFIFLDTDDLLVCDAVENLLNALLAANTDIAIGDWYDIFHDTPDKQILISANYHQYPKDPVASLLNNLLPVSSFMVRRTSARWDEQMVIWEVSDYLYALLAEGFSVTYIAGPVTKIRHHSFSNRVSIKYGHFEAMPTGTFYANCKAKFATAKNLTFPRAEVLDHNIFLCICSLVREKNISQAKTLATNISWNNFSQYKWYKWYGATGMVKVFGITLGLNFHQLLDNIVTKFLAKRQVRD